MELVAAGSHIIKTQQLWGQSRGIWWSSKGLMFLGGLKVCKSEKKKKEGKKTHLSSLMQAEWMCLETRVLLSHGGVFDFKPIFSWSLYFIKSISVHYIKSPLRRWEEKASSYQKPHTELRESKPLIGIGVYTFMNQTNKCYHKSCCSCQPKCIIAVILPSQSFTLSAQILHSVFCSSAPGFLSVPD